MDWIDVRDEKPVNGERYLVCCKEFGFQTAFAIAIPFISSLHPDDPRWWLDAELYGLERPYQIAQTVTHFVKITLPEFYQQGRLL
jgi:hypothetical protein